MKAFPKLIPGKDHMQTVSLLAKKDVTGPNSKFATFMIRMVFADQASNVDFYLRAFYDVAERKDWDMGLTEHFLVAPTINGNMVVIEEEAHHLVRGYTERESILKRFYWRDGGHFYVYQSSVPDEVHPDEDAGRDDATRFDLLHQTSCFKRFGDNDLLVEQVF
mmetsp:Transcript_5292/g.6492  ORF Transcript_5292/g.6492 Transcript_5292/m.6492 type:complete len:163 (+) Transcript_5292:90-578(+)